uniref:NGIWY-amide prohormone n=1 Tax=Stichopus japonicus TaxID=307972 RepID=K4PWG4_STIJA|nr:NGIWY-amide prohormone [Apostichopus japonicus]
MAVEAKIVSCLVCIWLTSTVYSQSNTGRTHDYGELSKAVDTFLDILMDEENFDDVNNIESWETVLKEDINPKLRILAHVMRSLSSRPDTSSLREQVFPNDYISRYLQEFLTDEQPFWDESSPKLPSLQTPELDQIKASADERNNFWSDNPSRRPPEGIPFSAGEESKRNGIWYGKRKSSLDGEAVKRNGIWYGKRSSPPVDDKRNGIWYGKRNGIWYGKRNGIWYGKRDDSLYSEEMM